MQLRVLGEDHDVLERSAGRRSTGPARCAPVALGARPRHDHHRPRYAADDVEPHAAVGVGGILAARRGRRSRPRPRGRRVTRMLDGRRGTAAAGPAPRAGGLALALADDVHVSRRAPRTSSSSWNPGKRPRDGRAVDRWEHGAHARVSFQRWLECDQRRALRPDADQCRDLGAESPRLSVRIPRESPTHARGVGSDHTQAELERAPRLGQTGSRSTRPARPDAGEAEREGLPHAAHGRQVQPAGCRPGQVVEVEPARDAGAPQRLVGPAGPGEQRGVDRRRQRAAVRGARLVELEVGQRASRARSPRGRGGAASARRPA